MFLHFVWFVRGITRYLQQSRCITGSGLKVLGEESIWIMLVYSWVTCYCNRFLFHLDELLQCSYTMLPDLSFRWAVTVLLNNAMVNFKILWRVMEFTIWHAFIERKLDVLQKWSDCTFSSAFKVRYSWKTKQRAWCNFMNLYVFEHFTNLRHYIREDLDGSKILVSVWCRVAFTRTTICILLQGLVTCLSC